MKNWINKNIMPVMAGVLLAFCFTILLIVLRGGALVSETVAAQISGTATAIIFLVANFYFSSSKGSRDKDDKANDETK
jgi:hypothetical protein